MKKEYRTEFIDLERKVAIVRFLTKKLHTFWVSKTVTVWSALEQQLQTNWLTGIAAVKIGTEANIIQEGCINRVAMYGVKYTKIIEDGDSNVYKTILVFFFSYDVRTNLDHNAPSETIRTVK
ncbi:UNVERIFIED_CONTAM: hypothetical protein NCL1_30433 [Trichonephila clavipes]